MNNKRDPVSHPHADHTLSDHQHPSTTHRGLAHDAHDDHDAHEHVGHHARMATDFRRRFFLSLFLMVPILVLSPMIQMFMAVNWRFPGDSYLLFGLSTALFLYGGWPFIKGSKDELAEKSPAMMTLISLAIVVA